MRLLTCERSGAPRLRLLLQDRVVDVEEAGQALSDAVLPDDMLAFIEQGAPALEAARRLVTQSGRDNNGSAQVVRLLPAKHLADVEPHANL